LRGRSGSDDLVRDDARDRNAWREYELLVDLYKFYLGLVVQAAGAYFLIVGGILTLVLANVGDHSVVAIALVVPILLSLLGAVAGFAARPKVEQLGVAVRSLGDRFEVTLRPHVEILKWLATGFLALLSLATVLLAILWFNLAKEGR
jgi:hypothetical protein